MLGLILEGLGALAGAFSDSDFSTSSYYSGGSYSCLNSEGNVDNSDCSEDEPYCNCPCQDLRPDKVLEEHWAWLLVDYGLGGWLWRDGETNVEPTDKEIQEAYEKTIECELIEDVLGEDYLGCLWKTPNHPSSCNCPCQGSEFKKYVEYNRTDATYWDTPKTTPLWRNAQMQLINSQKMSIVLNGDLTLRPGKLISIANVVAGDENSEMKKKITGRWLVSDIEHIISSSSHKMNLILTRDSTVVDPNTSKGLLSSVLDFLGSFF